MYEGYEGYDDQELRDGISVSILLGTHSHRFPKGVVEAVEESPPE